MSTASAYVPPPFLRGDIDNNGSVNTADLTALAKYVAGKQNYSADRCDVNGDGVVNINDVNYLTAKLTGNTTTPAWTNSKTVKNPTSNNTGTVWYTVYDYNAKKETKNSYSITPTMLPNTALDQPHSSLQGNTDPIPISTSPSLYTDNAVVRIKYTFNGVTKYKTGFIVGSNKVVSTANCAFENKINKVYATSISILTSDNTEYPVLEAHIPSDYLAGAYSEELGLNYTLLKINNVKNNITKDLTDYGKVNLGIITDDKIAELNGYYSDIIATPIAIVGYSSSENSNNQLRIGWGTAFLPKISLIYTDSCVYTNAKYAGTSGGPILYMNGNDKIAIGLYSYTISQGVEQQSRYGRRFTIQQLNFFLNNPKF